MLPSTPQETQPPFSASIPSTGTDRKARRDLKEHDSSQLPARARLRRLRLRVSTRDGVFSSSLSDADTVSLILMNDDELILQLGLNELSA